jgi:hypothetical protein
MSNIPADLKYAKTHEWARVNDDGSVTVGISDNAQEQLGDMVYVEVPDVGKVVSAAQPCAVVESVKAASDVYARLPARSWSTEPGRQSWTVNQMPTARAGCSVCALRSWRAGGADDAEPTSRFESESH